MGGGVGEKPHLNQKYNSEFRQTIQILSCSVFSTIGQNIQRQKTQIIFNT